MRQGSHPQTKTGAHDPNYIMNRGVKVFNLDLNVTLLAKNRFNLKTLSTHTASGNTLETNSAKLNSKTVFFCSLRFVF